MRRGGAGFRPAVRVGLLVATGVGLTGAALWAGSVGPWIGRPQGTSTAQLPTLPPVTFHPPSVQDVDPPAATPVGSTFDPTVVLLVLGAVLLVALVLIAASLVRNRVPVVPTRKPPVRHQDEVLPAPVAPDPDRPFDHREAADYVIACWEQLEQQAAGRGKGRRPEQTPTEFMEALKQTYPLQDRAATELLALYQRARFDHVRLLPDTAIRARTDADLVIGALGAPGLLGAVRTARQGHA